MSSARPLRERLQSNSPDPDVARPTTPLRINKHASPQARQGLSPRQPQPQPPPSESQAEVLVARRSSSSFKHVRENKLVSKSPFRLMRPQSQSQIVPASPTRRASGEKRPRPDSMHAQAENEKPLGFKRRQSRAFQFLCQTEPVTKSPFLRPLEPPDDPLPPVPPPKIRPKSALPTSHIPVPSPVRSVLSNPRRMHGPRIAGERQHQRRKTVTFDERCDVLEFEADEIDVADVSYDENGYGYGFSYQGEVDEDAPMEDSFEDGIDQIGNDSLTGMVDSMLQAALPHTPPRHEDEEDADLLPPSPSPAKPPGQSPPQHRSSPEPVYEGSSIGSPVPHPEHSHSQLKDEEAPFEDSFRSIRSDDSLDPSNLSIGHSEVSITNLDSHSLLADIKLDDGDILTGASFAPVANSSPRTRSRSGTPLDRSFDRSFDRSLEARSTPVLTPSRLTPRSGSGSPFPRQIFKQASASSLGSLTSGGRRSPITREAIQERLLRRKSEDALEASRSATSSPAPPPPAEPVEKTHDERDEQPCGDTSQMTEPAEEERAGLPPMTRHNPTHDGVMSIDPEPQPIDPPRPTLQERAHSIDGSRPAMDAKTAFEGLDLDFGRGFALGEEGMSVSAGLGTGMTARAKHSSMHLGDVSALDKLMEDMAQGAGVDVNVSLGNVSLVSEGQSYGSLRVEAVTEGVKAATFALPDIAQDDEGMGIDLDLDPSVDVSEVLTRGIEPARPTSASPPPPPPPAKDAIRAREELIKAKKREARERDEGLFDSGVGMGSAALSVPSRPARRRSMSTGDATAPRPTAAQRRTTSSKDDDDLLDLTALRSEDAPLADTINRELRKRENRTRSKYHVREHTETIYASSDARTDGSSDMENGRPWRTIRRPSDMNEHAKQLRELREQQKAGKAHGKVFVKVVGLRGLEVPIPEQSTKISCTLNNGIHFVTTPDAPLDRDCTIDQEFELIEHSKLEFTLTIKVRRDPHVVAQQKANQPPAQPARPPPQPLPPPASKGGSSRGMRSFLFGSPKKTKTLTRELTPTPPPPPPPAPVFKPQENLARYLKPDGSLGRAFISFKDIAAHCDTRLLETSFPLIGQKIEIGNTAKALQIGEIVLQIFRLPPLPGIQPEQLPQSLEECHRGLTHTRWHKSCYMQGMLTQLGGDCNTWRRRHLRLIGSSLVAYNDVTKRAIATIDLRKAIGIHDEQKDVRSPASAATVRSDYDDSEPYGLGGVSHSFKLEFEGHQITFYADTDQEKANWVNILKALVGRIPPNPLWAEVLFQRQEQAKHPAAATPGPSR
ncbi:hypothetical protein L226DRAFT_540672 [Lentinus tigrinus ALCF2SS1-7]|uniref:PH domain-containing protein n=1 Tax=Lentinus tigrinus ALCF2SS1-6 TaxID=1328759 RepID=A0A5C2RS87_9APHY|nr:hypothetical protein L227DRAFT_557772 [Lentinus tigrinus ALCF2SS1-6]RPD68482.1 hypothetical protein L226DRAFT_540672 [Lentinus tigrinus ALCF2SS1-7]